MNTVRVTRPPRVGLWAKSLERLHLDTFGTRERLTLAELPNSSELERCRSLPAGRERRAVSKASATNYPWTWSGWAG